MARNAKMAETPSARKFKAQTPRRWARCQTNEALQNAAYGSSYSAEAERELQRRARKRAKRAQKNPQ